MSEAFGLFRVLFLFAVFCNSRVTMAKGPPRPPRFPCKETEAASYQTDFANHFGFDVIRLNSIGMKLAIIPPGEFLMGAPPNEKGYNDRQDNDTVRHQVRISKAFYMGVYDVTQGEYKKVVGTNPSWFQNPPELNWGSLKGIDTSLLPVDHVTWGEAQEFCELLTKRDNKRYRLPTEAEWEYACRAFTSTPFNTGQTITSKEANFFGTEHLYENASKGPYLGRPCAVGSYHPNAFQLFDMHGNVAQWCQDWYDDSYYHRSPVNDPQGPSTGEQRTLRGGHYDSFAASCRSAVRDRVSPEGRAGWIGFRVVCEP